MKRAERKQLKGDEFVFGMGKVLDLLKKWRKELLILAATLVFLALVFLGGTVLRKQNLKKESQAFGEIISLRADLDKKPENYAQLEKIGGHGKFSRIVSVELATYWIEKGDWDKAEKLAGQVKPTSKDIFYYQAQDLLARLAVKKKDYDKALDIYNKVEEENPQSYPLDVILFHKGEALECKGDTKEALAVYKKLQEEYNQTYFGYEASLKVGKLQGGL